jgi:hypothetical protein
MPDAFLRPVHSYHLRSVPEDAIFWEDVMGEENKGFTVRDRRFSSASEESEKEAPGENAEARAQDSGDEPESPLESEQAASQAADEQTGDDSPLPQINFATFVFSLNSSALVHLGVIEEPGTGQKTKNLPLAKQTIDILGIIEEKTRGNLTSDEDNLLKNILHDLRIMYVREKG